MSASSTEFQSEEAVAIEKAGGRAADPDAPQPSPGTASSAAASSSVRNAFTELMSRKRPQPSSPPSSHHPRPPFLPKSLQSRQGLGVYITNPSGSPHLYFTSSFVAIRDLYPKSSVHCLLLPRDLRFSLRHPVEVLQSGSRDKRSGAETKDAKFFTELTAEAAKLKRLVASELERLYGRFSRSDRARQLALDGGDDQSGEGELPKGRDWEAEVVVGVHQRPSMAHLHVHVFSRDIGNSPSMKNAKHYNSFTTPFLVRLDEFPLAEDDARLVTGWNDGKASANADQHLKGDLVCWRCGRGFKRKFAELKKHLEEEFEEWKRE